MGLACSLHFSFMTLIKYSSISLFIFYFLIGEWSSFSLINAAQSQEISYNDDRFRCEHLARKAEEKYQLPKNILLSIARVESGYGKINGITRSWPWTLNAGGNSAYFETKADAIKDLKIKLKRGVRNVDLGCMQINYKWHKKFFKDVTEMIDPSSNVDYGARFLKRLYQRHGSWDRAIKFYHSAKSKYNKLYLRKVKAVWQRENTNKSSDPIVLAKATTFQSDNAISKPVKKIPIVKLKDKKNKIAIIQLQDSDVSEKRGQLIKVSSTNFETIDVAKNDFDFQSFVKRVSDENSAMPKYIRDNWTIVVSIRNQLRQQK